MQVDKIAKNINLGLLFMFNGIVWWRQTPLKHPNDPLEVIWARSAINGQNVLKPVKGKWINLIFLELLFLLFFQRSEHMIKKLPSHLDQPVVTVRTKLGPMGPSKDLQGPPRTSRAPKRAFLGLWGYLYDPSTPIRKE